MSKRKPNINALSASGSITTEVLVRLAAAANPGVSELELDTLAEQIIRDAGGTPAFLGHQGFPATTCISVNSDVLHGPPTDRKLIEGDLVKLDCGAKFNGWYTDSAITVEVGTVSDEAHRLREVAEQALDIALTEVRHGRTVGDMGAAVQAYVESEGMSVIRDCSGHGVGKKLHDEPSIPNYGKPGEGPEFRDGMVVAIEPIIALGKPEIKVQADKWTLGMADGSLGAHVEETVMITKGDPVRFTPVRQALSKQKSDDKLVKVPYGS